MAENNQQGSGKHPHQSGGESHSKNEQSGAKGNQKSGGSQKGSANEDLKSREGHHHAAKDDKE